MGKLCILLIGSVLVILPALLRAEDRSLAKAAEALDRQAKPSSSTGFQVSGESAELSGRVNPPQTKTGPADAGLDYRQRLTDTLTARAGSGLLVDPPPANPGASQLPKMHKQENASLVWQPSDRFGAEAFTRLTGQAGGEGFFDRADLERGATLTARPTSTTETAFTARRREGLDSHQGQRAGSRLDGTLSQKLGNLPLTASLAPAWENTQEGNVETETWSARQSLIWNASADTILSAGTNWTGHDSTRLGESYRSTEAFTRWERTVSPDLALAAQTSVESRTLPGFSDRDRQRLTLQAGPKYRLADDLSASLDLKSSFDHRDRRGLRDAEQSISFSLNGKF